MNTFAERQAAKIMGSLSCFDRVVITGTLPDICHAEAMARYMTARGVRLFDYPQFAMQYREEIRSHAQQLAFQNGLTIDFIRRNNFRKEERIKASWQSAVIIRDWCTSSRLWSRLLYISTLRSPIISLNLSFGPRPLTKSLPPLPDFVDGFLTQDTRD